MLALISLLIQLSLVHATNIAEWQYMLYTKDQLAKAGFNVKSEGRKFEAENRKEGVFIRKDGWSAQSIAKTMIGHHSDGSPHYEDLETTFDETKVLANTHCDAEKPGKQPKMFCRTITASYCASLSKLSDSGFLSNDLKSLKECGDILAKVDFDADNAKLKHEDAMKRISSLNGVVAANLESVTGPPRSLKSVIDDFHVCKTLEGKWQAPAVKTHKLNSTATN